MNTANTFLPSSRTKLGFSLIETVLALGIMGLAITALLGLLPHGIEMSHKAANMSAMSRIMDSVQSRLASNSFEALKLFDTETIHFDDQGVAIEDGGDLRSSSYVVRVKPGGSSVNAMLPGGNLPETTLLRFQVQIAATPNTEFNFDSAPRNAYESMPVLIAPLVP
jgi:uncharacterized protein (TIGR02598 family)